MMDMSQCRDDFVGEGGVVLGRYPVEDVVADGAILPERVEIDHVLDPVRRDAIEKPRRILSVEIEITSSVPVEDVLHKTLLRHRRFTRAGLSDHMGMLKAGGLLNAECAVARMMTEIAAKDVHDR